ncbi:hypothetical protein FRC03_000066 [Tulasnella sp. 419]|nr:hypothetical protein FRC02_006628 [Tulasnella sp. 418]KAG8970849.1 hypothetical protein FRC03_000066 [Tulasnella sp. 419]
MLVPDLFSLFRAASPLQASTINNGSTETLDTPNETQENIRQARYPSALTSSDDESEGPDTPDTTFEIETQEDYLKSSTPDHPMGGGTSKARVRFNKINVIKEKRITIVKRHSSVEELAKDIQGLRIYDTYERVTTKLSYDNDEEVSYPGSIDLKSNNCRPPKAKPTSPRSDHGLRLTCEAYTPKDKPCTRIGKSCSPLPHLEGNLMRRIT